MVLNMAKQKFLFKLLENLQGNQILPKLFFNHSHSNRQKIDSLKPGVCNNKTFDQTIEKLFTFSQSYFQQ